MGRPIKYIIGKNMKNSIKTRERRAKKKAEAPKDGVAAPTEQVKSQPTTQEPLSKEQIATLLADFTRHDPFALKGLNPRFRYRFINRSADRLDRQTMRGWEIVTGPDAEKLAEVNKIKLRQGQVIVGDSVLARIPMEVFLAIQAKLQNLNRRMIGQSSNTLRRDMGTKYSRNVEESLKVRDRGEREQAII